MREARDSVRSPPSPRFAVVGAASRRDVLAVAGAGPDPHALAIVVIERGLLRSTTATAEACGSGPASTRSRSTASRRDAAPTGSTQPDDKRRNSFSALPLSYGAMHRQDSNLRQLDSCRAACIRLARNLHCISLVTWTSVDRTACAAPIGDKCFVRRTVWRCSPTGIRRSAQHTLKRWVRPERRDKGILRYLRKSNPLALRLTDVVTTAFVP
jgi:hypothetical protein